MSRREGPQPRTRKAPKPFEGDELPSTKKTSSKGASKKVKSSHTQPKKTANARASPKKRVTMPSKPKPKQIEPKYGDREDNGDGDQQSKQVNDASVKRNSTLTFFLHLICRLGSADFDQFGRRAVRKR